jgi:hypothetical protein
MFSSRDHLTSPGFQRKDSPSTLAWSERQRRWGLGLIRAEIPQRSTQHVVFPVGASNRTSGKKQVDKARLQRLPFLSFGKIDSVDSRGSPPRVADLLFFLEIAAPSRVDLLSLQQLTQPTASYTVVLQ